MDARPNLCRLEFVLTCTCRLPPVLFLWSRNRAYQKPGSSIIRLKKSISSCQQAGGYEGPVYGLDRNAVLVKANRSSSDMTISHSSRLLFLVCLPGFPRLSDSSSCESSRSTICRIHGR
jgi:hypothetical protein